MTKLHTISLVVTMFLVSTVFAKKTTSVDVCIYGANSAGVIAAYTAQKSGKSVLLIEPSTRLGGLSTGGLGFTDIGNKYVVKGLSRDFYRRLGTHYGKLEQWIFEPSVAEKVFKDYVNEANLNVLFNMRLIKVEKSKNKIQSIVVENSNNPSIATNQIVNAKVFIDCTYEGDLMGLAGVSYTIGRESNTLYNETYNGVQLLDGHQFPDGIDPYKEKGNPASGLLWGISPKPLLANGTGDNKVQAYNYRICLTDNPANKVDITKPDNYDPEKYELLIRLKEKQPWNSLKDIFIWSMMPNRKTDINNRGGFSTDMIGMNWNYADASYAERKRIIKEHEDYTKGLLYFVGHDQRIPLKIRNEMLKWGYPKDEYIANDNWSPQLYVREARRLVGEKVMTQHHCQGNEIVSDPIAWAAYTMDSHNCDRHVVNGMVKNEGNVEVGGFPPYPISYLSLVPKRKEANNLIVPVCMSASHIAYGSIRMEPVFMVMAQSAAIAACQAIDRKVAVQDVDAEKVLYDLTVNPLADSSIPEILIDDSYLNQVSFVGEWKLIKDASRGYVSGYLQDDSKGLIPKSVRFTPKVEIAGQYDAYVYFPIFQESASQTKISFYDGNKTEDVTVNKSDIIVEGQTKGEWVLLGRYQLGAGESSYVEISNKDADNLVVADAVLFIPVKQ